MYLTVGKTGFLPKVFSQIDNVVWEGRCSRKSVTASCDMFASDQCQVVGVTGLQKLLQPCSRAARKWRENEEMD